MVIKFQIQMLYLFALIVLSKSQIENCKKSSEDGNTCLLCVDGYTLSSGKCVQCADPNCLHCFTPNIGKCYECKSPFRKYSGKCGIECSQIDGCRICSSDITECYSCKYNCTPTNGGCSCKGKIAVIIICCVISFIIIVIVILCLTKSQFMRRYKIVRLALDTTFDKNINSNQGNVINEKDYGIIKAPAITNENTANKQDRREMEMKQLQERPGSQVPILHSEEKQLEPQGTLTSVDRQICDYCLIEQAVIRLSCGCVLCDKHKVMTNESCPICHKAITQVQQLI